MAQVTVEWGVKEANKAPPPKLKAASAANAFINPLLKQIPLLTQLRITRAKKRKPDVEPPQKTSRRGSMRGNRTETIVTLAHRVNRTRYPARHSQMVSRKAVDQYST